MSDSYPTIQDALSDVQKEFLGCVEMHLDPPGDEQATYAVEALYRCEDDDCNDLPGESIRFTLSVEEDDVDVTQRSHTIEFIDEGRARGWIRHRMKRMEALNGRYFWTESRFEVAAPGLPDGLAREADVEREVLQLVDRIRLLDRRRKLIELSAAA